MDCIHSFLGWRCRQGKQQRTEQTKTRRKKQASACITEAFPSPPPSNHNVTPGTRALVILYRLVWVQLSFTREGSQFFLLIHLHSPLVQSNHNDIPQSLWLPFGAILMGTNLSTASTHSMALLSFPPISPLSLPPSLPLSPSLFQSILSFCLDRHWRFFGTPSFLPRESYNDVFHPNMAGSFWILFCPLFYGMEAKVVWQQQQQKPTEQCSWRPCLVKGRMRVNKRWKVIHWADLNMMTDSERHSTLKGTQRRTTPAELHQSWRPLKCDHFFLLSSVFCAFCTLRPFTLLPFSPFWLSRTYLFPECSN